MSNIFQSGSVNLSALLNPGVYIDIQPPTPVLNGVPSNGLGIEGSAQWGPVNTPVVAGGAQQAAVVFGQPQNRKYDLMTAAVIAGQQGANNLTLIRVTDGTDVAATLVVQTSCITFTSKYTGSFGNSIQVSVSPGSQTGTFKVGVGAPNLQPESFDNIGLGLSGNALWVAIAAAVNNGTTAFRGPSNIIIATAGAGTTAPATAVYTLATGTDGASSVTATTLIGSDTATPRTGMYAFRNTGVSVLMLADADTSSTWPTQMAFALSEGLEIVYATPSGDTIANALSVKASGGIDSYDTKSMFGDWITWLDSANNQQRVVSPQAFVAGLLANLSPEQSACNKRLQGIIGTQKSVTNAVYVDADIQQLVSAGLDVIANPSPGGNYFSCRIGCNTSSNPIINDDSYPRMTNFLSKTLLAGMGQFIGNTTTATLLQEISDVLGAFLQNLWDKNMIGNAAGTVPYSVQCNAANNPQNQVALGFVTANVQVTYLGILKKLIVNLTGGSSVSIQTVSTAPAP